MKNKINTIKLIKISFYSLAVVIIILIGVIISTSISKDNNTSTADTASTTVKATGNTTTAAASSAALSSSTTKTESSTTTNNSNSTLGSIATGKIISDFTPICQYPELPTGCEITSLTMVLNHNGVKADKCDLSDNYLDKGDVGTVDFHQAFEGDPRDANSFGCYSPVIVNTANKYLASKNSALRASNITGSELSSLYSYINKGIPVIVWGTQDCQQGHYSVTWNVNGKDLTWFTPEHCMVLVGYDNSNVRVADPIYGSVKSYDKAAFLSAYNSLGKQAVVIK